MKNKFHVIAGTYGKKLEWIVFDAETEAFEPANSYTGIINPSFLAADTAGERLYAVSEKDDGELVCLDADRASATLTERNRQPLGSASPCHTSLSPDEKWLFTANYGSGDITVHQLEEDGSIGKCTDFKHYTGRSIVPDRQEASHLHAIRNIPGTDNYIASDLGADRLYVYRFEAIAGKLMLINEVHAAAGSGPRHIEFHPTLPIIYVADELHPNISVYKYKTDFSDVYRIQQVRTIPREFNQTNYGADIHIAPSGKHIYVSNRGHDSITAFKIDEDGLLQKQTITSTEGNWPRNFAITPNGSHLLAANERSHTITALRIVEDGGLEWTGESYPLENPVCLKIL